MNEKILEGCEKLSDGRYRIHETITVIPFKKEHVNEKIMVEGKTINSTSKYTFLVWDEQFNANGRNYKYVIDRVIKEGRTTITLINHPEDDNVDMNNLNGVAKNPRRIDGWLAVDWYPADCDDGKKFASVFDLGGPLCISSSVLGNLDAEGYVINDDTFELERYFDFVDSPSNRVYHSNNKVEIHNDDGGYQTICDSGLNESNKSNKNKNLTIIEDNSLCDNDIGDKNMSENDDELLQTSLEMNITSLIKDAEKIADPFDKKTALMSADDFAMKLKNPKLHDEITSKIEDIDGEIKTLSDKGKDFDTLTTQVNDLNNDKSNLENEIATLKEEKAKIEEQLKTITKMYEDKQYKASEIEIVRNNRLYNEVKLLKSENGKIQSELKETKNRLLATKQKMNKVFAESNSKVSAEDYLKLKEELNKVNTEKNILERKVNVVSSNLTETNMNLQKSEAELNSKVDVQDVVDIKNEVSSMREQINKLMRENNQLSSKNRMLLTSLESKRKEEEVKKDSRFNSIRRNVESKETRSVVEPTKPTEKKVVETTVVNPSEMDEDEDDEDSFMEKALNGDLHK